jgi:hypothetical protein
VADAVENLHRVTALVAKYLPPRDPARRWFESGVREFLQVGGPRLDEALGLRSRSNGRTPAVSWLYLQRDDLIRAAVERAGSINDFFTALEKFERTEWPAVQRLKAAPAKWPPDRREFFDLLHLGVPVPRKARRLQQILTAARATSSRSGCVDAFAIISKLEKTKRG